MRYILVNDRTPREGSACFMCGNAIEKSYVREIGNRLFYCDQLCLAGAIKNSTLMIEYHGRMVS